MLTSRSPGDRQMMPGLYEVYQRGQTHFQVGDNINLFDYTYVGNIARAHLLAADKLVPSPSSTTSITEHDDLHRALSPVSATTGYHRVPTCTARPLGPYLSPPPNASAIETAFTAPHDPHAPKHPIVRSRFDQFSENALSLAPTSPLRVAGEAFFITNGEPIYFWDFLHLVWLALDPPTEEGRKRAARQPWVIPRSLGMMLGFFSECWATITGKEAGFTRYRVSYSCAQRYHNIEKARRVLGYEPEVGLQEGVDRMVQVCASYAVLLQPADVYIVVQGREWAVIVGGRCMDWPFITLFWHLDISYITCCDSFSERTIGIICWALLSTDVPVTSKSM